MILSLFCQFSCVISPLEGAICVLSSKAQKIFWQKVLISRSRRSVWMHETDLQAKAHLRSALLYAKQSGIRGVVLRRLEQHGDVCG